MIVGSIDLFGEKHIVDASFTASMFQFTLRNVRRELAILFPVEHHVGRIFTTPIIIVSDSRGVRYVRIVRGSLSMDSIVEPSMLRFNIDGVSYTGLVVKADFLVFTDRSRKIMFEVSYMPIRYRFLIEFSEDLSRAKVDAYFSDITLSDAGGMSKIDLVLVDSYEGKEKDR